jgi:hypothetical protein
VGAEVELGISESWVCRERWGQGGAGTCKVAPPPSPPKALRAAPRSARTQQTAA